jgi:hypothetical protein
MRNANETSPNLNTVMRATFEVPRELVEEFRQVAKRNDRTLSGELRQLMREAIERDRNEQVAA